METNLDNVDFRTKPSKKITHEALLENKKLKEQINLLNKRLQQTEVIANEKHKETSTETKLNQIHALLSMDISSITKENVQMLNEAFYTMLDSSQNPQPTVMEMLKSIHALWMMERILSPKQIQAVVKCYERTLRSNGN